MIINLRSNSDLSGFYIVFRGSTNLETSGNFGISHLLEHLICRNLKKIQDQFFREGITWNAYTSLNEVVFYFRGLEKNLSKFREKIIDIILDLNIERDSFKREKDIILEEYSQYFSRPSSNHFYNFSTKYLNSYGPMGLKEDIENISQIEVLKFYEKYFLEPSLVINVSRNLFFNSDIKFSSNDISKKWILKENKNASSLPSSVPKDQESVIFYSKLFDEDFAWINFINLLLSADHGSILLDRLRFSSGLVYDIEANQTLFGNQSLVTISTSVSQKNSKKAIDLVWECLEDFNKKLDIDSVEDLKMHLIQISKMKKIDRYKNINRWIFPKNWDVESILKDVDVSVLEEKIKKYYNPKNFEVSIQSSK
jgi:predicted Zn-dependent peptidase